MASWCAYLLRCRDGSLYAGATGDLDHRLAVHQAGRGARYTRSRLPVALAWRSPPLERRPALRLEWRLKQLRRPAKLLLAAGTAAQRCALEAVLLRDEAIPTPVCRTGTRQRAGAPILP